MIIRLALLLAACAAAPASAQRLPPALSPGERYDRCLDQAARKPADGFEEALAWAAQGGGEAARHCAAVALLNNGQPEAAATRLEQLAQDMRIHPPALRAEVVAQAGRAWLAGRDPARAAAAFSAALELAPANPELWIDRSEAYAAAQNYWEAIDDLNRALELAPRRADAHALRAAAYRLVGAADLAREDAARAIELDPRLPEGWLERGLLAAQAGDMPRARADLLQVLVLDPDGPAGDAARAAIERMELKADTAPAPAPRGRRR